MYTWRRRLPFLCISMLVLLALAPAARGATSDLEVLREELHKTQADFQKLLDMQRQTQRAMEVLFAERNSGQALSQFVADTEKARGKPVQRVNPALAFVGRGSADVAFYEALLKRLNDTARIPDGAPEQLADARARAVAEYLVKDLAVPAARVAAKSASAPEGERARLAFDVARPPAAPQAGNLDYPRTALTDPAR